MCLDCWIVVFQRPTPSSLLFLSSLLWTFPGGTDNTRREQYPLTSCLVTLTGARLHERFSFCAAFTVVVITCYCRGGKMSTYRVDDITCALGREGWISRSHFEEYVNRVALCADE